VHQSAYGSLKLRQADSGVSGDAMRFLVKGIDDFDADAMDLIFELFGPVEVVPICLYKHNFSFKNTNRIYVFLVVFLQVNDLVVQKLIILMPFYYANGFLPAGQ
jgi:hypothetical protein